jgi:Tfp pilus assembly protein PilV
MLIMKKNGSSKLSSGQSLIEVLIITVLVASILTAIASVVTKSLQSTAENKRKNAATNLSQEAIEMFRQNRQILGWDSFQTELSSGVYCLDTLPTTVQEFGTMTSGECGETDIIPDTEYTREAEIFSSDTEVQIEVTVRWNAGRSQEVSVTQVFKDIQD